MRLFTAFVMLFASFNLLNAQEILSTFQGSGLHEGEFTAQVSSNAEFSFATPRQTNYLDDSKLYTFRYKNNHEEGVGSLKLVLGAAQMPEYRQVLNFGMSEMGLDSDAFLFAGTKYRFFTATQKFSKELSLRWTTDFEGLLAGGEQNMLAFSYACAKLSLKLNFEPNQNLKFRIGPETELFVQDFLEPLGIRLAANPDHRLKDLWMNACAATTMYMEMAAGADKLSLNLRYGYRNDECSTYSAWLNLGLGRGWFASAGHREREENGLRQASSFGHDSNWLEASNNKVALCHEVAYNGTRCTTFSVRIGGKRHKRVKTDYIPPQTLDTKRAVGAWWLVPHPQSLKGSTYEETMAHLICPEFAGVYTQNFYYDNVHDGKCQTPRQIWSSEAGVCAEQNRFVAEALKRNGYEAGSVSVYAPGLKHGHSMCVYRDKFTKLWNVQDYNCTYYTNAKTAEDAIRVYMPGYTQMDVYDPTRRRLVTNIKSRNFQAFKKAVWGGW